MQVVARRTRGRVRLADLPIWSLARVLPAQVQCALDRLGRLDARLDVQVAHQRGVFGLERVVQRMMQLDSVLLAVLPTIGADRVKHRRKLAAGFREGGCLGGRWVELDADRALHMRILPYTAQMFNYGVARRRVPSGCCRLKAGGSRAVAMPY